MTKRDVLQTGPEQKSVRSLKATSKIRGTGVSIQQAVEFKLTTRVKNYCVLVDWDSFTRHD